jgi:hypothetical protein
MASPINCRPYYMKKILILTLSTLFFFYSCKKHDNNNPGISTLTVSRPAIEVSTYAGYTDTFSIQSDGDWTIALSSGTASWLSLDTLKGGSGSTIVKLSVIANNTAGSQSGTITVSPVGNATALTQIITIKQTIYSLAWQKSLGGSGNDMFFDVLQTADGGYVAAGLTSSNDGDVSGSHGDFDGWVLKVDGNGNKLWQTALGSAFTDQFYAITTSPDGGYVVAGDNRFTDGNTTGKTLYDVWVVKLNANGNQVWSKSFGSTKDDLAYNIINTADGGYLVSGSTFGKDGDVSANHGDEDIWLLKIDGNGNKVWERSFGGSAFDEMGYVALAADGGYFLVGTTHSNDGDVNGFRGVSDVLVVKLDVNGNKLWSKTFGGSQDDNVEAVIATKDGGCALTGSTYSNDGDISGNHGALDCWVLKLDNSGQKMWSSVLGGSAYDDGMSLVTLPDGGYMVSIYSNSTDGDVTGNHGSVDVWAVKLNSNGKKLWQKSFGSTTMDWASSIITTADGGILFAGKSTSNDGDVTGNHGIGDGWLIKLK